MKSKYVHWTLVLVWLSASVVGQEPADSRFDYACDDRALVDVLADLESLFEWRFSYVDQAIADVRITCRFRNLKRDDAMRIILEMTPVGFRIVDGGIIVLFHKEPGTELSHATMVGVVVDSADASPLDHANIVLTGTLWGTTSDATGRFRLPRIPYGVYRLRCSVVGYRVLERSLAVAKPMLVLDTLRLAVEPIPGEPLIITGERSGRSGGKDEYLQPSVTALSRRDIMMKPGVLEPDLFRAIQTLPGVTAPNDISNELYVRGGTPDQNLILLDNMLVHQPYHLFGIAGILNTDIISDVHISSGGFSSRYGNRLSSVIDVQSRNHARDKWSGAGTVSLLSTRLMVEGEPYRRWYYLVSGRRTYLDQATALGKNLGVAPESIPYKFYDLYGKLVFRSNANHTLQVSGFGSTDDFSAHNSTRVVNWNPSTRSEQYLPYRKLDDNRFVWSNFIAGGHWSYHSDGGLSSDLTMYVSQAVNDMENSSAYRADRSASDPIRRLVDSLNAVPDGDPFEVDNIILDRTVKWDIGFDAAPSHRLLTGIEVTNTRLHYYWNDLSYDTDEIQAFFDSPPDSFRYRRDLMMAAWYIEDTWRLGSWTVRPGLRMDWFEGSRPRPAAGPRLTVRYDHTEGIAFKASTGLYYQSLFTSRERGYVGFLELPFSTKNRSLQKSWHIILGLDYTPSDHNRFTAEAYFKSFENLSKNRTATATSPVFISGRGQGYGLELTWMRRGSRFSTETYYTLGWARRSFDNGYYYTNYDQRHTLSLAGTYALSKTWELGFRWLFATGRAYQPNDFITSNNGYDPSTGSWSSDGWIRVGGSGLDPLSYAGRMPMYHRLDISLVKTAKFKHWTLKPFINILNVYYRTNPLYFWSIDSRQEVIQTLDGERYRDFNKRKAFGLPIIPTLGVHFEF